MPSGILWGMDIVQLLPGSPVPIGELPDRLLSRGTYAFTSSDAARAAGISPDAARVALARLVTKKLIFSPARGLYICIPPEYRTWGALPAPWFVDPLMNHLGRSYYVGLLSAAEQHGAAHQRPQSFQVVVDRKVRDRTFGRVRLRFVSHRAVSDLPTVRMNVPTGTMAVSTPELTAVDLANRPDDAGGLHNLATVVIDLAAEGNVDVAKLTDVGAHFPIAAGRRLGWLLDQFTELDLAPLAESLTRGAAEPSALDPHGPRLGHVDQRWHLRINATVEPD
jgi:predicted transcriptional regulator of viral defense system